MSGPGTRPAARGNGRQTIRSQAEILKLARLLHREPQTFAYLEGLAVEELRALREQATDVLFSANQKTLGRLAAASKLLPAGVIATIAEKAFGPLLAALITGMLDPSRAVDVAGKLPPPFLADIAIELDPRRSTEVIAQIPPGQIAAVSRELIARGEYVTMGRFVGHLPDESLRAALACVDDANLLRIGFVLEQKERIDHVVALLDPARYEGLIEAANGGLWPEALDLLGRLEDKRRRTLAEIAIQKGDPVLEPLVQAAEEHDMWEPVLALESVIGEESRERFVEFIERCHPELRPKLGSRRGS